MCPSGPTLAELVLSTRKLALLDGAMWAEYNGALFVTIYEILKKDYSKNPYLLRNHIIPNQATIRVQES